MVTRSIRMPGFFEPRTAVAIRGFVVAAALLGDAGRRWQAGEARLLASGFAAGKHRKKPGFAAAQSPAFGAGCLGGLGVQLPAAASAVVTRSIRMPGFFEPRTAVAIRGFVVAAALLGDAGRRWQRGRSPAFGNRLRSGQAPGKSRASRWPKARHLEPVAWVVLGFSSRQRRCDGDSKHQNAGLF